jgi:hypothetical protein
MTPIETWDKRRQSMSVMRQVDEFLEDIVKVYKKHGLSLAHEDGHGSFIVEPYSEKNIEWLNACQFDIG